MEFDVESILSNLGINNYESDGERRKVRSAASIQEAAENDVTFCRHEGEKGIAFISNSNAGVILCRKSMEGLVHSKPNNQIIFLENPRLVFINILKTIYPNDITKKISPTAVISKTAKIGSNCYIGDYVIIGENCTIGNNTIIREKASIIQNCSIGDNCIIQSGVTIGSDGFAFERYPDGNLVHFPHIKGVKIEDNVEICTNSSIARGSLSDTIIGNGTKIDALVHVAHNVIIGERCILTAGTIIGGSTSIGNMCWTGLNSTLKDNIKIGNNIIIAAGAMVINDVKDGDIVAGVPAKSIQDKVKLKSKQVFLMSGQRKVQE